MHHNNLILGRNAVISISSFFLYQTDFLIFGWNYSPFQIRKQSRQPLTHQYSIPIGPFEVLSVTYHQKRNGIVYKYFYAVAFLFETDFILLTVTKITSDKPRYFENDLVVNA